MDQKHFANLDPKLKEVYERVMGTQVNFSKTPIAQQPTPTLQNTVAQPAKPGLITQEINTQYQPQVFTAETHKEAHPKEKKVEDTNPNKKNSSAAPAILVICGILFFIAYAIFWMRLFDLSVPFLPF